MLALVISKAIRTLVNPSALSTSAIALASLVVLANPLTA